MSSTTKDALPVSSTRFRLNTELYPDSVNTYDSLADAYFAAEYMQQAAAAWRQVLEVLPRDSSTDPEDLQAFRLKAEARLVKLGN